jgi:hypothetical protein
MIDDDESVRELSLKTVEELWFPPTSFANASPMKSRSASPVKSTQDKASLLSKVSIIMGVAANFNDRQSPLEDLLHKIIANKSESEAAIMHQQYVEICEVLIDGLVDASDLPGFVSFLFQVRCVVIAHISNRLLAIAFALFISSPPRILPFCLVPMLLFCSRT